MARTSTEHSEPDQLILIIDDSVEIIHFLSALLRDKGKILFATTPEVGLELATRFRPALVLLDVEMPGMNGYEVCRRLLADPVTQDCAILFVTGHSNTEAEVAALEAGAVDFISKPLIPAIVRARVQTHLSLQQKSRQLTAQARIDGLTGIANRRYFDEQLAAEFLRHRRHALNLGIAMIDIDLFKAYNDGYGHLQGDDCLRRVATALATMVRRPGEFVARYGGEEFAIILPFLESAGGSKVGDWICERVRQAAIPHAFSAVAPIVTVSVGVAIVVPDVNDEPADLIGLADQALYRAKGLGRNRSESTGRGSQAGAGASHTLTP